jgi:hypothetical protein
VGAGERGENWTYPENNISVGYHAGRENLGDNNIFLGTEAGESTTSGDNNIFIGYRSGYNNTGGEGNIFIGPEAGNFLPENASNRLVIANSATTEPLVFGDFWEDYVRTYGHLVVDGYLNLYDGFLRGDGKPPMVDCDAPDEAGRIIVTVGLGVAGSSDLYICRGSKGWGRLSDSPFTP